MTDSLIAAKERDGFKEESPIRAFTQFQVNGLYAIGKGFRPSLTHLSAYLDAMETKEGWAMLQVILPDNDAADPTIMFRKTAPPFETLFPDAAEILPTVQDVPPSRDNVAERYRDVAKLDKPAVRDLIREAGYRDLGDLIDDTPKLSVNMQRIDDLADRLFAGSAPADDPINPKHYDGTACAEIIEYMPANVALAAKYIWRLGEKDPIEQEIGKTIWYLNREIVLHGQTIAPRPTFGLQISDVAWYRDMAMTRIDARRMPDFRESAMFYLVEYTVTGRAACLSGAIESLKRGEETGTGLAV